MSNPYTSLQLGDQPITPHSIFPDLLVDIANSFDYENPDRPSSAAYQLVEKEFTGLSDDEMRGLLGKTHMRVNTLAFGTRSSTSKYGGDVSTLIASANNAIGIGLGELLMEELMRYNTARAKIEEFKASLKDEQTRPLSGEEYRFWRVKLIGYHFRGKFIPGLWLYATYADIYSERVELATRGLYRDLADEAQFAEIIELLTAICAMNAKGYSSIKPFKTLSELQSYMFAPLNPTKLNIAEAKKRIAELQQKVPDSL